MVANAVKIALLINKYALPLWFFLQFLYIYIFFFWFKQNFSSEKAHCNTWTPPHTNIYTHHTHTYAHTRKYTVEALHSGWYGTTACSNTKNTNCFDSWHILIHIAYTRMYLHTYAHSYTPSHMRQPTHKSQQDLKPTESSYCTNGCWLILLLILILCWAVVIVVVFFLFCLYINHYTCQTPMTTLTIYNTYAFMHICMYNKYATHLVNLL